VSSRFETLVVLDRAGGRPFVVNYQYYLSGQVNLRTRRSRVEAQVLRTEYKYPSELRTLCDVDPYGVLRTD